MSLCHKDLFSLPAIEAVGVDVLAKYNPLIERTPVRKNSKIRAEAV